MIPLPTRDMIEIGYENHGFMELGVPSSNRLLAGFVKPDELPHLINKPGEYPLSKYAMVQVVRNCEFTDFEASDFNDAVDDFKKNMGDNLDTATKEGTEEMNRRLAALDSDQTKLSLSKPIQLGCIFSKQDAFGYSMVLPLAMNGNSINMGTSCAFLRVRKRLLVVYLYSEYKSVATIQWLNKTTEEWVDAILGANK